MKRLSNRARRAIGRPAGARRDHSLSLYLSVIIALCAAAAFWNSLGNGYAYDDMAMIAGNSDIRSFPALFSSLNLYRPLRWLSFAVDYRIWKLNPLGFHITNLILHIACVVLVFRVMRRLFKDLTGPFIVALLFAVYPIATETVDNLSNRNDLLAGIFCLSAFSCYMRKHESMRYAFASFLLFFLALLSKEAVGIALPLVFIGYDWYFEREGLRRFRRRAYSCWIACAALSAGAFLYAGRAFDVAYRMQDVERFLIANSFADAHPVAIHMSVWFRAMYRYIRLIVYPNGLSADYPVPHMEALVDTGALVSVFVVVVFILALVLVYRRSRIASFGLFWFIVFLAPASNLIPIAPHFVAERYLYLPSVGYLMFIGTIIRAAMRSDVGTPIRRARRIAVQLALVVCVAACIGADWKRNGDWYSNYTIWESTVERQPESPIAHLNLGLELQRRGNVEAAREHYERTTALYRGYNVNFAAPFDKKHEPSSLMSMYYAAAHNNLASVYVKTKRYGRAIEEARRALAICGSFYQAHFHMGISYLHTGRYDEAIEILEQAVAYNDAYINTHQALATAYARKGMTAESEREKRRVEELKRKRLE